MKDKEKSRGDQLREALCYDKKNGYDRVNREELEAMEAYCTGYKRARPSGSAWTGLWPWRRPPASGSTSGAWT